MIRHLFVVGAVVAGTLGNGIARAQSPISGDWTVTVGVLGGFLPEYVGSDRYQAMPWPIFEVRRAGTPWRFTTLRDGFGFAIVDTGQFRFGPVGQLILPRDQDDSPALRGLGNVDWAVEIGAFAEFWPVPWLRTRAEVRQGFGGHDGIFSIVSADLVMRTAEALTLSAGPRLTLATSDALQPYFGVTPAQSVTSGLPVYSPGGGLRSYGFGAQAHKQWTREWATRVFVEYERLADEVANSPVLFRGGSPDQVMVGAGVSYSFDITVP